MTPLVPVVVAPIGASGARVLYVLRYDQIAEDVRGPRCSPATRLAPRRSGAGAVDGPDDEIEELAHVLFAAVGEDRDGEVSVLVVNDDGAG